uniref:UFSP2 second domain-containing protein n=1 Tax=Electrophorus electricus TaxID=8005 RepID=A0A4W4GSQ0_ELEEL
MSFSLFQLHCKALVPSRGPNTLSGKPEKAFELVNHQSVQWCDILLGHFCFALARSVCRGLVGALRRQLLDMEDAVLRHRKGSSLLAPQAFHFPLPMPGNLITVVYPAGVAESQLLSEREYGLPSDRPCFRSANAFHFPDEPYRDGYLRNPHAHLTPPSMEDSKVGTWDI